MRKNREFLSFPGLNFPRRRRKQPLFQYVMSNLAAKLTANFKRGSGKPYRGTGTAHLQNRDRKAGYPPCTVYHYCPVSVV